MTAPNFSIRTILSMKLAATVISNEDNSSSTYVEDM